MFHNPNHHDHLLDASRYNGFSPHVEPSNQCTNPVPYNSFSLSPSSGDCFDDWEASHHQQPHPCASITTLGPTVGNIEQYDRIDCDTFHHAQPYPNMACAYSAVSQTSHHGAHDRSASDHQQPYGYAYPVGSQEPRFHQGVDDRSASDSQELYEYTSTTNPENTGANVEQFRAGTPSTYFYPTFSPLRNPTSVVFSHTTVHPRDALLLNENVQLRYQVEQLRLELAMRSTKCTLPLNKHFPTVDELLWRYGQTNETITSGRTTSSIVFITATAYYRKLQTLEAFLAKVLPTNDRRLHPTTLIKKFVRLRVECTDIVVRTLLTDLDQIRSGTIHYGGQITWNTKEVTSYIFNKLARVAGYRCKLDKPLRAKQWAEPKVANLLIKYLWTDDTHWFRDPNTRMNLHLLIALLSVTGVRPSSILRDGRTHEFDPSEDVEYQKSKLHGLRYGDIELGIIRHEKNGEVLGPPIWRMSMKFTNQKNSRAMDGGLTDSEHILEDIEHSTCCVVTLFVAHALKAGAIMEPHFLFKDTTDVEYRILSFKKEFLDCEVIPMKLAAGYPYFKNASARAGFNRGKGLPLYAIRRGTYTQKWKDETQSVPDRLIQFNHKSIQVGVTHYHSRAIYVQSRDVRRGIEVSEAERRLPMAASDDIFHPSRKLVRSYYAHQPEPYNSNRRREFIYSLIQYDEGTRGVNMAVEDQKISPEATLECDVDEIYESDMDDDNTDGNDSQEGHMDDGEKDEKRAHQNERTEINIVSEEDETESVSDEDETDMEEDGRLVAEMENKMDYENERDFEMPDLPDDNDLPHDTETDTAPANGNGNGDGYASNDNNYGEAYACCLNARHQHLGLRVHLEQQHQVVFSGGNQKFVCACGQKLSKQHQITRHITGHTSCQFITTSWDCTKARLPNNIYCQDHDREFNQHNKHICCSAALHEGEDIFNQHVTASHAVLNDVGEGVCYVCDSTIRNIATHLKHYHILCWSGCSKPRAFPALYCSSHKDQPLNNEQWRRRGYGIPKKRNPRIKPKRSPKTPKPRKQRSCNPGPERWITKLIEEKENGRR